MESRSAHLWDQFFDGVPQWYPLGPILWWNPAVVVSGTYSLPSSTVAISGTYSLTESRSGHLWALSFDDPTEVAPNTYSLPSSAVVISRTYSL
jgi:hypothetical protein